jgi:hypothetical protein
MKEALSRWWRMLATAIGGKDSWMTAWPQTP